MIQVDSTLQDPFGDAGVDEIGSHVAGDRDAVVVLPMTMVPGSGNRRHALPIWTLKNTEILVLIG